MIVSDFKIGDAFIAPFGDTEVEWRVTDVGSRVVVAIRVTLEEPLNLLGPPYSVAEVVWDEEELECVRKLDKAT